MLRLPHRSSERTDRTAALSIVAVSGGVLILHSALVLAGIGEVGTLAVNVAFAVVMVALASSSGIDRAELGLVFRARGARFALGAGAVTATVVLAAAGLDVIPTDASVAALSNADLLFRVLIAIPVGTPVCEEVLFRGVLLATFDRLTNRWWPTIATSALFGLWHVAAEAARTGGISWAVLPGAVATAAVSALVLCPLRQWSRDLAAPIAVHAVANVGVLLAVAVLSR